MALLEDLKTVAKSVTPADSPSSSELHSIVGALIKSLEASGFTVAEDLLDTAEPEIAPVVNEAAAGADKEFESLKERLGKFLEEHGA